MEGFTGDFQHGVRCAKGLQQQQQQHQQAQSKHRRGEEARRGRGKTCISEASRAFTQAKNACTHLIPAPIICSSVVQQVITPLQELPQVRLKVISGGLWHFMQDDLQRQAKLCIRLAGESVSASHQAPSHTDTTHVQVPLRHCAATTRLQVACCDDQLQICWESADMGCNLLHKKGRVLLAKTSEFQVRSQAHLLRPQKQRPLAKIL